MLNRIWICFSLLALFLLHSGSTAAQGGVVRWLRHDINLTLQQNSGLAVEEIHQVALVGNATTFQRAIPTDRLNSIANFRVIEIAANGIRRDYRQTDTPADYTFRLLPEPGRQMVELYFPANTASSTTFILQYFVDGAMRFYDAGDQLEWRPFGEAAPAPIDSATITVNLPDGLAKEQLAPSSQGFPTETFIPEANKAIFRAAGLGSGDSVELFLSLPHGFIQGNPPPWQREADTLRFWSPILGWGSVILALLFLLLGLLAVYGWWYMRLRIPAPSSKKLLRHVKSPPNNLSPALAGVLLDGKATPRHLMAILLNLAAKGALHVYGYEQQAEDDSAKKPEFKFDLYNVDQEKAAQPYEAMLYGKVFGYLGARKRELQEVRRTVYMTTPELKTQLELEIAKAGYLNENSKALHRQYAAFGGAGIIMSLMLGLVMVILLAKFSYLVIVPFISLAIVATVFGVIGFAAPKRTKAGQKEVVRWQAFKQYLSKLDAAGAAAVKDNFTGLLPYAVAFGLEKRFVEAFIAAGAPIPSWWSIPEEKVPDIHHEKAYAWVSNSFMEAEPAAGPEKGRSKSVIRRLGTAKGGNASFKDIQPIFTAFLAAGFEVFSKTPLLSEDEAPDFESLGQPQATGPKGEAK
jgi:hypothetical protein